MTDTNIKGVFKDPKLIIQKVMRSFKTYKWLILIFIVCSVAVVYFLLLFVSDKYITYSSLLVGLGRENVEVPVTVERGGFYSTGVKEEELNSEIQILTSRDLVISVINNLGVEHFREKQVPPENLIQALKQQLKEVVNGIRANLQMTLVKLRLTKELTEKEKLVLLVEGARSVYREKESNVINVSIEMQDPALSMDILNELLKEYFMKRIEVRQNEQVKKYFNQKVSNYKQTMETLEKERKEFSNDLNLYSVSDQQEMLLERLHNLQTQLDTAKLEHTLTQKKLKTIDKNLLSEVTITDDMRRLPLNLLTDDIKEKITQKGLEQLQLSTEFTNDSDLMKKLDLDIAKSSVLLEYVLINHIKQLGLQMQEIKNELASLNTNRVYLENLNRELNIAEANYMNFAKKKEEALLTEELDTSRVSNISVLTAPQKPIKPASPARMQLIILSFVLGFIISTAIAFLLEFFNERIYIQNDLEDIENLPFIGVISLTNQKRFIRRINKNLKHVKEKLWKDKTVRCI